MPSRQPKSARSKSWDPARLPADLPASLSWLKASEEGRTWLAALPGVVERCVDVWRLHLGRPFSSASTSLVMPARLEDGTNVVLKIRFPHRESEHEGLALAHWGGNGAVRLLAEDSRHNALLVERCVPGSPLSQIGQEEALDVMVALLPRLWKPATAPPFRALAEEAAWWASDLRQRWEAAGSPFDGALIDAALDALDTLSGSQGEQVLLHQDLHGDNLLRAQREPWLAIDPKPLVGEREFGLAPVIRSFEFGHSPQQVRGRLDRLSHELTLDRERGSLWCIAQTIAWSIDSHYHQRHIETAQWLLEA